MIQSFKPKTKLNMKQIETIPFILCGVIDDEKDVIIDENEGKQMALKTNVEFFEIHYKKRNEIDEMFNRLIENILNQRIEVKRNGNQLYCILC